MVMYAVSCSPMPLVKGILPPAERGLDRIKRLHARRKFLRKDERQEASPLPFV